MTRIDARFRTIPGTQAATGTSGTHHVVADRPAGVAGGGGLGFNGGQLLALSIGGCLSNDIRYVAHADGVDLDDVGVDVALDVVDGTVTGATVAVSARARDGRDTSGLVARALTDSTVLRAVRAGFPVDVV